MKPIENDTKMEIVEEDKLFFCYCQRVYNEGEVMICKLRIRFFEVDKEVLNIFTVEGYSHYKTLFLILFLTFLK